jgi:parallel beta-helix repeat protein
MQKKTLAFVVVAILAFSVLAGFIFAEPQPKNQQMTTQNIVILPDGSVSPQDAPIKQNGNTYTFTGDCYGTIRIQKSNIILDGAGHTLMGPYNGSQANVWVVGNGPDQSPDLVAEYIIGIDLGAKTVEGITIQNFNIKNFSIGMYIWTKNNTIVGNAVSESILGILLSGSNTTISDNYLANNQQGLFFGFNGEDELIPSDVVIVHNSFVSNNMQINGCFCETYPEDEEPHSWDNGRSGNYWSDYNGTDTDGDGIGDTPYVVDVQNQDRYPLMQNNITVPQAQTETQLPSQPIVFIAAFILIAAVVAVVSRYMKKKH